MAVVKDEMKFIEIDEKDSYFGRVDRSPRVNDDGTFRNDIGSAYPAYMHGASIGKLEDSIRDRETSLESGFTPSGDVEYTKRMLAKEKARLVQITESEPHLTPEEEMKIKTEIDRLEPEVSSSMFTRSDMEKNIADANVEATRMKSPCIQVDKEQAAKCHVPVTNGGLTSRDNATRMWQMLTWIYTHGDASTLSETLRRDRGGSLRKSNQVTVDIDLKELEFKRIQAEKELVELEQKKIALETDINDKKLSKVAEFKEDETINQSLGSPSPKLETIPIKEIKKWTCPDCDKEMTARGKNFHLARWCKAKKEEPVLVSQEE